MAKPALGIVSKSWLASGVLVNWWQLRQNNELKRTMNNKQVAHLWANQSRPDAKGSHFYFVGGTIYSYGDHFPIARHYKGVVLFTSRDYSVTTQKHKGYVRSAASHLKMFTVANVMANPSKADIKDYRESIERLGTDAARARNPEWKLSVLQREVDEANDFAATFGFKTRFAMPDDKTLAELKARAIAASVKKAKQTAERNARIARENAELVQRWLAGEQVSLPYNMPSAYLRVKGGILARPNGIIRGEDIPPRVMETSKGATVPLDEAHKAYRFCMLKRAKGWHRNGEQFPIGEFQLDAINEQGVVAGCHRITWNEIERFAKAQGWIKSSAPVS